MARAKKKQIETEEEVLVDECVIEETASAPEFSQEEIRLIEAMLFASSSALTVEQMSERFPEDRASVIPAILEYLQEQYASRGVNLVQRDKRWALRTATDLADQLRLEKEQPKKFTRAAMETMAIIAYHQPVTRAEIENIRGVATSPGALDALMEAGWIKPGKRREVPGRPVTWLSTQAFLDHFGLERLEDLPGMDELKASGLLDKRPAIEAIPTSDLFGDDENAEDPTAEEITDEDLIGSSALAEETDESEESDLEDDEDFDGEDAETVDSDEEETDSDDDEDFDDEDDEDDSNDDSDEEDEE